ncbi:MAG: hypothetical protein FWC84_08455, partial [Alphaproteobacteria bacterium]|nr:hypothetical protein [Alphaproteobacteria bacterium]
MVHHGEALRFELGGRNLLHKISHLYDHNIMTILTKQCYEQRYGDSIGAYDFSPTTLANSLIVNCVYGINQFMNIRVAEDH